MSALRAVVAVPARDEEQLVGRCLRALAAQEGVDRAAFEVVLVLDGCTDATRERALAAAGELVLHVVERPPIGVGAARRLAMDTACARLEESGAPDGLVVSTDADSAPEPGWLAALLAAAASGARAIGGEVVVEGLDPRAAARRATRLARRLEALPGAPHPHFSGASIAVTAQTYRALGGLEPRAALEDEALARALARASVPIARVAGARVRTSGRPDGRAFRGLARDLALDAWLDRNSLPLCALSPHELADRKTASVSVVVPAREVAETIGPITGVLAAFRDAGAIDELVVVDAGSHDGTAAVAEAAGATVLQEDELMGGFGPCRGKGDAMWRALSATSGELVAFVDADTRDFEAHMLSGLLAPLFARPELALVKGTFERPFSAGGHVARGEGGRVTELTARPLINLHRPALAGFAQPLAGELAARRSLLEGLAFPVGYGVEIAMLLDALDAAGIDALAQADLGTRQNRHQPLRDLSAMSYAVLVAASRRLLGEEAVDALAPGPYVQPDAAPGSAAVRQVAVEERPPLASLRDLASAGAPTSARPA
ncbi:MAG: glucosyl-3-phosphoglycerate synthase [Solirubrobacteraceae bacterium]